MSHDLVTRIKASAILTWRQVRKPLAWICAGLLAWTVATFLKTPSALGLTMEPLLIREFGFVTQGLAFIFGIVCLCMAIITLVKSHNVQR